MPHRLLRHPATVTILVTVPAVVAAAGIVELTLGWFLHQGPNILPTLIAAAIPALTVPFAVYPLARSRLRNRDGNPPVSK